MTVIPLHGAHKRTDVAAPSRLAQATYTVPEVAGLLGTGTAVVYRMLRAGEIPARRMGDRWIISRRRFHYWLDGDDQAATVDANSAGGAR